MSAPYPERVEEFLVTQKLFVLMLDYDLCRVWFSH